MKTEMNLFTCKEYTQLYKILDSDKALHMALLEMQEKYGVEEQQAKENTAALIHMTAQRENLCNMLSEDAEKVFEEFLMNAERMNGYDRKLLLHEIHFGLELYRNEQLLEKHSAGCSLDKLFREYYSRYGEDPAVTQQILEEEIRDMMGAFRVSPQVMRKLTENWNKSDNLLASAAALGEEGMRFKCIVAMDLYMRNQQTMTLEEAVNVACTEAEIQAVADSMAFGRTSDEAARKIIGLIAKAAVFLGVALTLAAPAATKVTSAALKNPAWMKSILRGGMMSGDAAYGAARAAVIAKNTMQNLGGNILLGGYAGKLISNYAAGLIGRLCGAVRFLRHANSSKAVEAMHAAADRMEARQAQEQTGETVHAEQTTREVILLGARC